MAAAPSYQGLGITTVRHLSAASRRGDYSVLTSKEVCLTWVWRCAGRASPWSSRAVLISPPQTLSVFLQQHNWLPVTLTHECMALRGQNVHTDKHRFTFSRMKAHIHKGCTQHGSSSLSLSLFSLILVEFVLLSESLSLPPSSCSLSRAEPGSVNI